MLENQTREILHDEKVQSGAEDHLLLHSRTPLYLRLLRPEYLMQRRALREISTGHMGAAHYLFHLLL